jgi:23S rRNA pseudouridine2605 synthase
VAVNGAQVSQMGAQVTPDDCVELDGRLVTPVTDLRYILYHKPWGEVTTVCDDRGRDTVLDRFQGFPVRIYPVGRLDYDSGGLLLLTNDGALTQRLLHPSRLVDKAYLARVTGRVSPQSLDALRRGVPIGPDERPTAPAQVRVTGRETFATTLSVTIHEGRNRQVRRMFQAVGHRVLALRRVRFGPLSLGDLPPGAWRELTAAEVESLQAL